MLQGWIDQRTTSVQSEIALMRKKDGATWKLCVFMVFALATAFLVLVVPTLVAHTEVVAVNINNLPELSIGLICLVALFAIQLNRQRRELMLMREALFRRLLLDERKNEIMDPETQTYSSVMLQSVLERMTPEVSKGSPLSILDVQIQGLSSVRRRNGDQAVDHLIRSLAEILRSSLRGSDRIFKSGDGAFSVLMPNTSDDCADIPVRRIIQAVDRWNGAMVALEYRLNISVGRVTSVSGDIGALDLLREAKQQRISIAELLLASPATA